MQNQLLLGQVGLYLLLHVELVVDLVVVSLILSLNLQGAVVFAKPNAFVL